MNLNEKKIPLKKNSLREDAVLTVLNDLLTMCKIQTWFSPFNDLVIGDLQLIIPYLERKIMIFMYKFSSVFFLAKFITAPCTVSERILIIFYIFYIFLKVTLVIPKFNIKVIRLWGACDGLSLYISNMLVYRDDMPNYKVNYLFAMLCFYYFPGYTIVKVTSVAKIGRAHV